MDIYNNILENIKRMMMSAYGKLISVVFIIIALATFFLATVQNNDTAFSFFRGIMSAVICCFVILGVYFLITKIVGKEVIENKKSSNKSILSETDEFSFSNDKTSDDAILNDDTDINPTLEKDDESINQFDINDLDDDKTSIMDKLNSVDKNPKVSYPSGTDTSSIGSTDSVETMSSDRKAPIDTALSDDSFIDFSSPSPPPSAATGDTETMAKAVRTMRSKDKEKEN